MPKPVIVSAVRTAIGTSFKGSLVNTPAEVLATTVLQEAVRRSGVEAAGIDDVIFAESHYGGGCSLGHPIAATGARMLTTVVHELGRRGGGFGVAAMCAGGGQGGAVVVEV